MTVKLVHVTPEGDELIAYMARVSNPSNQSNPNNSKLIKYLVKHNHWSPFEMVNMCVEINTTRSISSQILRHRSFTFQEFSQRYANVDEPSCPHLRLQDPNNRQNSIDAVNELDKTKLEDIIKINFQTTYNLYLNLLESGIAKECARQILPLASPTKLYMNGTLRSWLHYVDLRSSNGTQLEHQTIANQVKLLIKQHFPNSYLAFFTNDQ